MNELDDAVVFVGEHTAEEIEKALEIAWENNKHDILKENTVVSKDGKLSFDIEVDTEALLDSLYMQIISDGVVDIPEHIKTADDFRTWLMEDGDESKN